MAYYANNEFLGAANAGPWTYTWSTAYPGSYTITAKAIDNGGAVTRSTGVAVTVKRVLASGTRIVKMLASEQSDGTSATDLKFPSIALGDDGSVWAWGAVGYCCGQTDEAVITTPVRIRLAEPARDIFCGSVYGAVLESGAVVTWGRDSYYSVPEHVDPVPLRWPPPDLIDGATSSRTIASDGTWHVRLGPDETIRYPGMNQLEFVIESPTQTTGIYHYIASEALWKWPFAGTFPRPGFPYLMTFVGGPFWLGGDGVIYTTQGSADTAVSPIGSPWFTMPGIADANVVGAWGTRGYERYCLFFRKTGGETWVLGENDSGQLGDATTVSRFRFAASNPRLDPFTTFAFSRGGGGRVIAVFGLRSDGSVWGWGNSRLLGGAVDPSSGDIRPTPIQIPLLADITQIVGGGDKIFALRRDGSVFAWGYNSKGQLGIGTTEPLVGVPTRIPFP